MDYQATIEVSDLAPKLGNSDLVILDCRYNLSDTEAAEQVFLEHHIPGAHYASLHRDLSAPSERFGGRHPLPSPEQFSGFARRVGIGPTTQVVVYDDQRLAFAARAWWLLRYFGHSKVAILNGGFSAWQSAEFAVESGQQANAADPGDFIAAPQPGSLIHHQDIFAHLGNPPWQLIDAREPQRFAGREEAIDPIAGHIPNAINKPWQGITDEHGKLKTIPELVNYWRDLPADDQLACYCGSGVTACVNLFALHLIGRENVLLYPGSWSDWCAHMLHPVPEAG